MFCPYCRTKIADGLDKCNLCGKNVKDPGKESEYQCTDCKKNVAKDAEYCWSCGARLESSEGENLEYLPTSSEGEFKHLIGYGSILKIIGWIFIIVGGIVAVVMLLSLLSKGKYEAEVNLLTIIGSLNPGLTIFIEGVFCLIAGEAILCFVAIEKNTKQTVFMMGKMLDKMMKK